MSSMFTRNEKPSDSSQANDRVGGKAAAEDLRGARPRPAPVPSLIGTGLKVKGDLESAGEIQVDGEVEGDVRGKSVVIGEAAIVKGSIFGDTVTVSGTIEGKVEAMTVTVLATARLTGDIIHETVKIEQGAYVDGRCSPQFGKAQARPAVQATVGQGASTTAGAANGSAAGPASLVPPHRPGEAPKDRAAAAGRTA